MLWGKSQVYAVLINRAYTGTLIWGAGGKYHQQTGLKPVRVEGAWPALVEADVFQRVQETLRSRAPKIAPPRRTTSRYLLSGLIRCGGCGKAMFGVAAKSGRFHYYVCSTAYRNGRSACGMASVPQVRVEDLVLDKVRELILQKKQIEALVKMTNEELRKSLKNLEARQSTLDSQLVDVDRRLERLYEALETRKLGLDELAPRIKHLTQQRGLLLKAKLESEGAMAAGKVDLVNREEVLKYIRELRILLENGSSSERRALLRSFVKSIVLMHPRITINYALPIPPAQVNTLGRDVLDFVHSGTPGGTRTHASSSGGWRSIL